MSPEGPVEMEGICLACGHCVAVCPQAAIDNTQAPLSGQIPIDRNLLPDEIQAEQFLRARRSVRCYKTETVAREKIMRLLDIARLAPSGGNTQGVSYHVVDDQALLREITARTVDWMEGKIKEGDARGAYYAGMVAAYRDQGRDVVLRDAPCLIIALTPRTFQPRGRDNTHFSLAYAELLAPPLGLGTCWAGVFESCAASGWQPLLSLLSISEDMLVSGALMVGIPRYTYQRLVERKPLQVSWQP